MGVPHTEELLALIFATLVPRLNLPALCCRGWRAAVRQLPRQVAFSNSTWPKASQLLRVGRDWHFNSKASNLCRINRAEALQITEILSGLNVVSLILSHADLGQELARAIAAVCARSACEKFKLSWCDIGERGAEAIAGALQEWQGVKELELNDCRLGCGATFLAGAIQVCGVRLLSLKGNGLGDSCGPRGAAAIGAALPNSRVTSLSLSGNRIGDDGAESLASALPHSAIRVLLLNDNRIGDSGAAALGSSLPGSSIASLDLRGNAISCSVMATLIMALPTVKL